MKQPIVHLTILLGLVVIPICNAQSSAGVPVSTSGSAESLTGLQELLNVTPAAITFHVGDVISVTVYGLSSFGGQQRIEQDGTIRFPFIGKVTVAGLTVSELEEAIESKLSRSGIAKEPQATVIVVSQPWNSVTVSGDVAKPGLYPVTGKLTLIDYVSEAGGLVNNLPGATLPTNSEASTVVTLVRASLGHPVQISLGTDAAPSPYTRIPLISGDTIRVGRVGVVYAVGAFRSQGAYPLKSTARTTVVQLMAMAGGIGFEGMRKDAHIIRTEDNAQFVLDVDIDKILRGKVADVALQPNDILFVPTNQMKAALKGGGTGALVSFTNSLLLYNR